MKQHSDKGRFLVACGVIEYVKQGKIISDKLFDTAIQCIIAYVEIK